MKARLGRTPVEQCAGREALPAELPTMRARPKPVATPSQFRHGGIGLELRRCGGSLST